MCNDNQCIKNGTYIACALCKDVFVVEKSNNIEGFASFDNNCKIRILVCPKCYQKLKSMENAQISVGFGNANIQS